MRITLPLLVGVSIMSGCERAAPQASLPVVVPLESAAEVTLTFSSTDVEGATFIARSGIETFAEAPQMHHAANFAREFAFKNGANLVLLKWEVGLNNDPAPPIMATAVAYRR